QVINTLPINAR
ncbi:Phage antirepressor protein KilAC domain protein, partial [Haemophilus influenzae]